MQNKVIIVIGGSSGMGKSVASQAHVLGAKVFLTSRDENRAAAAAQSIDASVKGMALDVNKESEVKAFFEGFDQIDHIYIAAGGTKIGNLLEGDLSEHMSSFDERLLGSLRVVRAAAGKIQAGGSITFTGGVSTDRPIAGAWVAGLGTASAEQLARVLVMELPHIRFNAVSPGYTDTPMWDSIMGENKAQILASIAEKIPVRKIATSEEVASAVIFLMANQSVTGEVIHIDGGLRLV